MKTRSIILTVILIFAVTSFTNGQVGGYLKSKVNRAVDAAANAADKRANQEIDKKAEEEVNKAADKIVDDAEKNAEKNKQEEQTDQAEQTEKAEVSQEKQKSGNENTGGFNLGALMGGGTVTSKYKESYSFNNRIYMQAEMYDGKDVVKMDYYIYFNDSGSDAGIETKMAGTTDEGDQVAMASTFIADGANKSFLMLSDMGGTKFGIISDVPDEANASAETAPKPTITKTGNSRVIAGYKCDEYLVKQTGKKEYSKVWLTKDLKLQADKRTFSQAGVSAYYDNPELRDAASLAMESYDDKGKLAMKSETKEINMGFKHTMTTTGYPLRQMNFSQMGSQK
jgi:hypothetical protein